ncbi:MAG: serine/threonine protein kinase [Myxococcaceae bacterium]|nr:serine/threonine protein kinase [Myxococcaceae bacterium]
MKSPPTPPPHPLCLPPGTRVGDWYVLDCLGQGSYGAVHRALHVGQEHAGPVALKLALYPWDPRFMREVALLSLVHHPGVPRLLGHGFWKHPAGTTHPYIVMEWVDGTPLYDWAREHTPSSHQLLQLLAQLARALEATHSVGALHRDVKGDNVLVRRSDGQALLMDFGAGHYQGAARLTWQSPPPGTPAYRSPEAGLFWIRSVREPHACYQATPADDVFALGVTAYRLLTGDYPPAAEPQEDETGTWHMEPPLLRAPRELNPRVDPLLSAVTLRMLSLAPGERGTARELAEALEAAARRMGPELDPPLREAATPRARGRPRTRARVWVPACALAMLGALLLLWNRGAVETRHGDAPAKARVASKPDAPDAGTSAVGEAAPSTLPAAVQPPAKREAITQDTPPKPFPGQSRPNEKGQCASHEQVPINGACWFELRSKDAASCEQNGYVVLKGRCFAPAFPPRRKPPPMSGSTDVREEPSER